MNEQIQALAYEAEDYADSMVDQGSEFHPEYTKKLAELIVQECLTILAHRNNHAVIVNATQEIKEHFGVK